MRTKRFVICIIAFGVAVGSLYSSRIIWKLRPSAQNPDNHHVGLPAREQLEPWGASSSDSTQERWRIFIDPKDRFSFQYESDGRDYGIEMNSPDIFSVCDALNCHFVGVEVNPLSMGEAGKPEYDYVRLTYDRKVPDSLETIEWNGYPAYRATFAWKEYPERFLFIHIPHNDQLFTLFRGTLDSENDLKQFRIMSETFRLL